MIDRRHQRRSELLLPGRQPIVEFLDGFGQDRHAVDIDDLQCAMCLVQLGLCLAQQGFPGVGIDRTGGLCIRQRGGLLQGSHRPAERVADFADDPG